MKKFIVCFTLCALLLAFKVAAQTQQSGKMPRVGYLSGTGSAADRGPYFEALRQGLQALGYTEGKNIAFEYRGAEGKIEPLKGLVKELVDLKVDVLVVPMSTAIRDAKQMTKTIPIVMMTQVDPVATGLIDSLARPGGNITGFSTLQRDLSGKRLELLKEAVPGLSRVGLLYDRDPKSTPSVVGLKDYDSAAKALKIQLQKLGVQGEDPDLDAAMRNAIKERAGALVTITGNALYRNSKQVAELAVKHRLPSMFEGATWVDNGGLLSYSAHELDMFRRAATYVDRILKGAKPADLPVEQPTKFEFAINLKSAKALGLNIPQSVLFRADKVIR
jgi:putative ABC transport system substrate-binding protein